MPLFTPPSSGGVTAHGALTGLTNDDHPQYTVGAPATAARNTVTPTADVVSMTFTTKATGTAALTEWYKSDGTFLVRIFGNDGNKRMQIGGNGYAATLGNAVLHIISDLSTQQVVRFIGRIAGAAGGAGIQALADPGVATASGDRMGYMLFGGAKDNAHTLANQAGFEIFATETWSGSAAGCEIRVETTHNTTTTRSTRVVFREDGGVTINNASAVPPTPASGGTFYISAGALHYLGSSGTDTVIAPA